MLLASAGSARQPGPGDGTGPATVPVDPAGPGPRALFCCPARGLTRYEQNLNLALVRVLGSRSMLVCCAATMTQPQQRVGIPRGGPSPITGSCRDTSVLGQQHQPLVKGQAARNIPLKQARRACSCTEQNDCHHQERLRCPTTTAVYQLAAPATAASSLSASTSATIFRTYASVHNLRRQQQQNHATLSQSVADRGYAGREAG